MYKTLFFLSILILLQGCSDLNHASNRSTHRNTGIIEQTGPLLVSNQLPAPSSVKSIELYRKGNPSNPPIIKLGSGNKLVLEFDELSILGGQYTLKFTHHNEDWSPSNIPEMWYLEGINDVVVQNGIMNDFSKPSYFHYKTEFPNQQIKFLTSGNYLVHVYDFASNVELFNLPFFVSEEAGKITSQIETIYNVSGRFSTADRVLSEYLYPEGIMFPQFELTASVVQNRFWGNPVNAAEIDVADLGSIRFRTSQERSFPAGFDFIPLDLSDLNIDNRRIIDWQPEFTPPRIILKEDVLNFSAFPTSSYLSNYGYPQGESSARYAEVHFNLDAGDYAGESTEIYVSGDFNQWQIDRRYRLTRDNESGLWETSTLIKQGIYRYKYFVKDSYTKSDYLPLNDAISAVNQEYQVFIYYKDPDYNYQRLMITTTFNSGN